MTGTNNISPGKSSGGLIGNYVFLMTVLVPLVVIIMSLLLMLGGVYSIIGLCIEMIAVSIVVPHFSITWAFNKVASKHGTNLIPYIIITILIIIFIGLIAHYQYSLGIPDDSLGLNIIKLSILIGFLRGGLYGIQSYLILGKEFGSRGKKHI